MAKVRFHGFQKGTGVTLGMSKDGVARGPVSISAWKQADGGGDIGTMEIVVDREPTMSAPEAVWFEARVAGPTGLTAKGTVYDAQHHELEWVWDFGVDEAGTFDHVDIPGAFNSKRRAHGRHVGHVFETPGDKTVTCTAYRVDYSAGTQTVVVVARKTIELSSGNNGGPVAAMTYSDAQTIYIDPTGAFPGAPAASPKYFDMDSAKAALNGQARAHIRFARGQIHEFDDRLQIQNVPDVTIGDFGTGSLPILTPSASFSNGKFIEFRGGGIDASKDMRYQRVMNLRIELPWDTRTETGAQVDAIYSIAHGRELYMNVEVTGANNCFESSPFPNDKGTQEPRIFFWNCHGTNWRNYGNYYGNDVNEKYISWRGFRMTQASDAAIGQDNRNTNNAHGPIRLTLAQKMHMEGCQFHVIGGWTDAIQPCIRILVVSPQDDEGGEKVAATWAPSFVGMHNLFEGGRAPVVFRTQTTDKGHWPWNGLFKRNIVVGHFDTRAMIAIGRGGTSIVENVFAYPDIKSIRAKPSAAGWPDEMVRDDDVLNEASNTGESPNTDDASNYTEPVRIIGNVLLDYKSTENFKDGVDDGNSDWIRFSDPDFSTVYGSFFEERDNVIYQPNRATPVTDAYGATPTVALTIDLLSTAGVIYNDPVTGQETHAQYASPATLAILAPGGDGTAAGGATGPLSREDAFGRPRPADAAQGALEPS
jgi:hypothetical protein